MMPIETYQPFQKYERVIKYIILNNLRSILYILHKDGIISNHNNGCKVSIFKTCLLEAIEESVKKIYASPCITRDNLYRKQIIKFIQVFQVEQKTILLKKIKGTRKQRGLAYKQEAAKNDCNRYNSFKILQASCLEKPNWIFKLNFLYPIDICSMFQRDSFIKIIYHINNILVQNLTKICISS